MGGLGLAPHPWGEGSSPVALPRNLQVVQAQYRQLPICCSRKADRKALSAQSPTPLRRHGMSPPGQLGKSAEAQHAQLLAYHPSGAGLGQPRGPEFTRVRRSPGPSSAQGWNGALPKAHSGVAQPSDPPSPPAMFLPCPAPPGPTLLQGIQFAQGREKQLGEPTAHLSHLRPVPSTDSFFTNLPPSVQPTHKGGAAVPMLEMRSLRPSKAEMCSQWLREQV